MKRIPFCFILSLFFFPLFSQTNVVLRESYDSKQIKNFSIHLQYENIYVSQKGGDEIVLEVSTNNSSLVPDIYTDNDTLKIRSIGKDFQKGDQCSIYLYIPKYFTAQDFYFENQFGDLILQDLCAENAIKIENSSGKTEIANAVCDFFLFQNLSENVPANIHGLNCAYFQIDTTAVPINLELVKAPIAKSTCNVKNGNIICTIPSEQNFEIIAHSFNSVFENNYNKTIQSARSSISYAQGKDGAQIFLSTHTGNIILNK